MQCSAVLWSGLSKVSIHIRQKTKKVVDRLTHTPTPPWANYRYTRLQHTLQEKRAIPSAPAWRRRCAQSAPASPAAARSGPAGTAPAATGSSQSGSKRPVTHQYMPVPKVGMAGGVRSLVLKPAH